EQPGISPEPGHEGARIPPMSHTNGSIDVQSRIDHEMVEIARRKEIERFELESTQARRTLEDVARIVDAGRRDARAIQRIVAHYQVANDSGIGEQISSMTLARVESVMRQP